MNDRLTILQGDALTVLKTLPDESVQCCVTSPPYWGLRDYGVKGQLGLEKTPEEYVGKMVEVFREVRRVLRGDGTLWLNIGDSYTSGGRDSHGNRLGYKQQSNRGTMYATGCRLPMPDGAKPKDLVGVPWMLAFALRADGWWLRQDIIWHKPNPMPESVTDRCTKAHEYIFLLTKSARYFYDAEAIKEPCEKTGTDAHLTGGSGERAGTREGLRGKLIRKDGNKSTLGGGAYGRCILGEAIPESERRLDHRDKQPGPNSRIHVTRTPNGADPEEREEWVQASGVRNKRSVWTVATDPYSEAHFATFPPDLIKPCILAGSKPNDTILDPFFGSGTTGMVALELGRKCIGIELNEDYIKLAEDRCNVTPGLALA